MDKNQALRSGVLVDRSDGRWKHRFPLRTVFIVVMAFLLAPPGAAQNLIINGTVNNTGTIRVKNQTAITPSSIGGEIELKGADQNFPAKQYQSLRLSGSGTKTATGGDLTVQKNLTVATPVTLLIPKGTVVTLGDTLFENGIIKGAIQRAANLTGSTTSSNFGNIGASIIWTGSHAPGVTNILRATDSVQTGNGNTSMKRYYHVQPTDASAVGTITLKYSDAELNGHDIRHLQLWRSTDGTHWTRQIPVVDTLLKTITRANATLGGYWTAADTVRALGPLNSGAGIPVSIAQSGPAPASRPIFTAVDTFKVVVKDIFDDPVPNVAVSFAVSKRPAAGAGGFVSDSSVTTNSSGVAATLFTLGSKTGTYEVMATAATLDTVRFTVSARHGTPQTIAGIAMSPQTKPILTALDSLFTITVTDLGGNVVDSAQVTFALANIPSGSFGEGLSITSAVTDSAGRASTRLTLGSKAAQYTVRAKATGIGDSVTFTATAIPGAPSTIARNSGDGQSAVNGQPLTDPFVMTVLDAGGNPVQGDSVEFKLSSNAFGAVLSKTVVQTDALGQASTILTLGTRTGTYAVSARSLKLTGSLQFNATALPGAAATLALVQGNAQSGTINTALANDLTVHIADGNGNSTPDTVTFSIDSLPNAGATGQALSALSVVTDSSGLASTKFTLGSKAGDYLVTARVKNVPVVTFRATAQPGAATAFTQLTGAGQSAVIASVLPADLSMRVVDIGGNAVSGTPVQFTLLSAPANATGQRLSSTSVTSDANGIARVSLTLGNKVGTYIVRAFGTNIPDTTFAVTATHGTAAAMAVASGLSQSRPILTALDAMSVRLTDIGDNPVSGSTVQFTIVQRPAGDTSAALNGSSSVTDSTGSASVLFTLGSKVGIYRIKASVTTPGMPDAIETGKRSKHPVAVSTALIETTFTAVALPGAPAAFASISGSGQLRPTNVTLDTAFTVAVRDIGGNAVPNAPVRFTLSASPDQATGQVVRDTLVNADSLGTASTVLTLGTREGLYRVTASVNGTVTADFAATAYYIYGDPNNDIAINIADVTAIVDQIIHARTFSFEDSLKADMNRDGRIDSADVNLLIATILDAPSAFSVPPFLAPGAAGGPTIHAAKRIASSTPIFSDASTQFEVTPQGLRLNLDNSVPVRGLEVRIRLKDTSLVVQNANYLFNRADQMTVVMRTVKNELRMVAYSPENRAISVGTGSVLRIPKITAASQIDTTNVTLSVGTNVAVTPAASVVTAAPGKYPTVFALEQNYPNPFNGATTIRYQIPDTKTNETKIALQIFNVLGQKVRTLVNAPHDPGQYSVTWNGTDDNGAMVASGIYFYRLITKNSLISKKMVYVK